MIRKNRYQVTMLMGACVLLLVCASLSLAASSGTQIAPAHRVVVVVANRLLLEDMDNPELPALARLLRSGSVGLLSPNCTGLKSDYANMLTAGAGASARGGGFVRGFYDSDESIEGDSAASQAYEVRTGHRAPPGSAVFLELPAALRANQDASPVEIQLGALGESLHLAGRKTAVIGNADTLGVFDRGAAVLAMDSAGRIDYGQLSESFCMPAAASGCELEPDSVSLARVALDAACKAEFVVVAYGFSTRLDVMRGDLTDSAIQKHTSAVMRGLDRLVGGLMAEADAGRFALIVASFGPPEADVGRRLTPIVFYTAHQSSGNLVSPTTRTPGLMAATDLAPSILSMMEVEPAVETTGRAAYVAARTEDCLARIREIDSRVAAHRKLVAPVLWSFTVFGALAFCGGAVVVAFSLRIPRWLRAMLRLLLVVIAYAPLAMLLAVLAPAGALNYGLAMVAAYVVLLALAYGLGGMLSRKWGIVLGPVLVAFALTFVAVVADSAAGGGLCRFALPSSFQLSGYRYYGIGNEYAAALVSMGGILALYAATQLRSGAAAAAVIAVTAIAFLGLSRFGANYGATIVAVSTFGLLGMSLWRGAYGGRHVLGFLGLGAVTVAMLAVADSRFAGISVTHAGRVTNLVQQLGSGFLVSMLSRKALLNLRLFFSASGLRALMFYLPVTLVWLYRVSPRARDLFGTDKRVFAGLKAVGIGCLLAIFLNDSGVVMASIMLVMLLVVLLYSLLSCSEAQQEARSCQGS